MVIECKHVWDHISGYLDDFVVARNTRTGGSGTTGTLRDMFCNSRFHTEHPCSYCGRSSL